MRTLILNKKLESLAVRSRKRPLTRMELSAPRLDYKSLLKDNKHFIAKKTSHTKWLFAKPKQTQCESQGGGPQDQHLPHFPEHNFDLESRIKALEQENTGKEPRKYNSLSNSRILENSE